MLTRPPPLDPPALVVVDGPFGAHGRRVPLRVLTPIDRVVDPATPGTMVRLNGQWLLRAQWSRALLPGDVLEVHALPQGGGGSNPLRIIAQLAAIYFLGPGGLGLSGLPLAGATLLASAAINALLPVETPAFAAGPTPSPSYTTNLSGNQARIDQPIPVRYGRDLCFPDFAAEPYVRFGTPAGEGVAADPESDEQYYHALMNIGMGRYAAERIQLDDTPLDHFADVAYRWLEPGEAPTLVQANVVTAVEVAGNTELLPGQFVGPFVACRPTKTCASLEFDIVLNGLGSQNAGVIDPWTVTLRFDARVVDDFGVPTAGWMTLGTETIEGATVNQIRRTFSYDLDTPARVEVRAVRTDPKDDLPSILNAPMWAGLRAVLGESAPLAANATYLEVRMRASEQLNGLSQRRIAVIYRRLLRQWNPADGWTEEVETRSIAWALADKWSNEEYGDGLPDSRMDLQTLYELETNVWVPRQDRLDISFDTRSDSDTIDQLIARAGRARVFRRNGVRTLSRDQAQDLPVTVYSSRDIQPGTARLKYLCDVSKIPDAIVVEYRDSRSFDWERIECAAPGVTSPQRPRVWRLLGVTGSKQAEREGRYEMAALFYRRRLAEWQTELQGLLPAFGAPVVYAPALRGWGSAGDVVEWDAETLTASLSEPPAWTEGVQHYISLQHDDGSLGDAIAVTPGATQWEVVLAEAPAQTPVTDDGLRERTRYVLGTATEHRRIVLLLGIRPLDMQQGGAGEAPRLLVDMRGVLEDDRVHTADHPLLPAPGEIQDPIDSSAELPPDEGGDPELVIVNLTNLTISVPSTGGVPSTNALVFGTDGTLQVTGTPFKTITLPGGGLSGAGTITIPQQWVFTTPIEPTTAALYEVRVDLVQEQGDTGGGNFSGAALATWHSLGTARTFGYEIDAEGTQIATLQVQIRLASSGLVQASRTVHISQHHTEGGGGGGGGG